MHLFKTKYRLFLLVLNVIFFMYMPRVVYGQQIEVATQKNKYSLKEKVILTITNRLPVSLFTIAASAHPEMGLSNIERKAAVGWDALPLRCRQPSCKVDYTMPDAEEIKPGGVFTFSWQPKIFMNNRYVSPEPGIYRVTVLYQVKKDSDSLAWNWTTARSNTFNLE